MMYKLNAKSLRAGEIDKRKITKKKNDIYIVLDNILDTYNIGSIFRLADAVGAKKIYLCEGSETPPNPRIKKASVNTTEIVSWVYFDSTVDALRSLKKDNPNIKIVAVEQSKSSKNYETFDYQLPIALVVGHETDGVSEEVLKVVDEIVELPMYGVNISLNVMVSLAIVLYKVLEKTMLKNRG